MPITTDVFHRHVRETLAHLDDLTYLQTHPLTSFVRASISGGTASSGTFLQTALLEAVESLRPDSRLSPKSQLRRHHQILALRYLQGLSARDVQDKIGIAKSQY